MLSSGLPQPGPGGASLPGGPPGGPQGGPAGPAPVGPVTQVQPKIGNTAAAAVKVKNAVNLLQEALPDLPMGDELHVAVLNAAKELAKRLSSIPISPAAQTQSRVEDIRSAQQQGPMAALQRLGGGAPGGAPAGPALMA